MCHCRQKEKHPYTCPASISGDVIDLRMAVTLRQAAQLSSQSKEIELLQVQGLLYVYDGQMQKAIKPLQQSMS